MKNLNNGFILPVLLVIIAVAVVGGGVYVYQNKNLEIPTAATQQSSQTSLVTNQQSPTNGMPLNVDPLVTNEVPSIIKNITRDIQTGSQKPENNSSIIDQVRKDVQNGKLLWFKDPVEVSKKYGIRFGIGAGAQYVLEQKATMGGESGLWHSRVMATYNSRTYRIYLTAEPSQPLIWIINSVSDIQQENKLRVTSFRAASTFDIDKVSHQDIVSRFGDETTMFYLNVKKPVVIFYLNQPAKSSSVNSDSITVKVNNTILSGAIAKPVTEQGSYQELSFPMYSVQVDLTNISNLKKYAGQNVRIILTDKIMDNSGNALQQCNTSYNKGECVEDSSGQKAKVYGAELKLYSL